MTTSTPPAWAWLDDFYVPPWRKDLSTDSHNLPDTATLHEQNDSGAEPETSCSTTRKLGPDCGCGPSAQHGAKCGCTAQLADSVINAAPSHRIGTVHVEKCPVCLHELENDEGVLCDHCGEPTGPGSFAVVNGPGVVAVYHLACYDKAYWGREDDGLPAFHGGGQIPKRETDAVEETFSVPFKTQEFMFESLAEIELDQLRYLIEDHHDLILEMARDRFRKGFARYGSAMYSWTPERRLDETLQELADATVYPTSGPIK